MDDPRVSARLSAGDSDGGVWPLCPHCPRVAHTGRGVAGVGGRGEQEEEDGRRARGDLAALSPVRDRRGAGRPGEPSFDFACPHPPWLDGRRLRPVDEPNEVRRRFGSDRCVRKSQSTMRSRGRCRCYKERSSHTRERSRLYRFAFRREILSSSNHRPVGRGAHHPDSLAHVRRQRKTGSIGLIDPISDSAASPKNV